MINPHNAPLLHMGPDQAIFGLPLCVVIIAEKLPCIPHGK